jgi:hypothetical protein
MATSKAQLVKHFKAVASYDESELTEAISDVLEENQRKILHELMKKLHTKLRDVKTQDLRRSENQRRFQPSAVIRNLRARWRSQNWS